MMLMGVGMMVLMRMALARLGIGTGLGIERRVMVLEVGPQAFGQLLEHMIRRETHIPALRIIA